jgi:predicted AAA+ superfamily ATPase
MYYKRLIDKYLEEWSKRESRKPVLLRGARQVGKSTAVRNLGRNFTYYVEINFERQPEIATLFRENLDVVRIVEQMSVLVGKPIVAGKTLLFLDEIQMCKEAIMALRFFKEEMPELHVIAAGSLLEFALKDLPTFGVGRIHSMFMYPMSFDEFLEANGEQLLMQARNQASGKHPLPQPLYEKLVRLMRTYMLIGGMPEVVAKWVESHDFMLCQEIQDDIVVSYEDDFPKYHKMVDPLLLRQTMRSVATQVSKKFVYSQVGGGYSSKEVKAALEMLILAGIVVPVVHTDANGVPLGSEANMAYRKVLMLDSGLLLRLLNMAMGDVKQLTSDIMIATASDLVNRGPMAELIAGLEMLRYKSPNLRHDLYYWMRQAKNSQAEIDYVSNVGQTVVPIEVKAGTQGGMKSLWLFMREKRLSTAVRCSLENFGAFDYCDQEADGKMRHVEICPLYALAQLGQVMKDGGVEG